MPKLYRHADHRLPFLAERADQPPARWHDVGQGPVQYLSDTPDGAWAEFLRHEEITDPADLSGVRRALWAVDVPAPPQARPKLPAGTLRGGFDTYPACREEAARLRRRGARGLQAPSAALLPGAAAGWRTDDGLRRAIPREGVTVVLFGARPDLVGWRVAVGAAPAQVLAAVHHLPRR
jgi:hypothetical protein